MTAVLLDSVKAGRGGWFPTRRGNGLRVRGMEEGDLLVLHFEPGDPLSVDEDGAFPLPSGVEMVSVEHVEVAARKNGGVCVDLIRRKAWAS